MFVELRNEGLRSLEEDEASLFEAQCGGRGIEYTCKITKCSRK
jgi:hypothetical protein